VQGEVEGSFSKDTPAGVYLGMAAVLVAAAAFVAFRSKRG